MEDGTLVAKDHETLWTKESYSNFILDLEFKVTKESNSGFFSAPVISRMCSRRRKSQVHESTDGTKIRHGRRDLRRCLPPRAGEADGSGITTPSVQRQRRTVVFNGEEVITADFNDWKKCM